MWETIGVWVEAIALIAIFVLDWKERKETRKERQEQHEETAAQLQTAQNQAEATKKSAEAAIEAAQAAKKSADIAAGLHRPFMGLLPVVTGWSGRMLQVNLILRNYGTLPAQNVSLEVDFLTDNLPRWKKTESESLQIFPKDQSHCAVTFDPGESDFVHVQRGQIKLRMDVRISYRSDDGRGFEYLARLPYAAGHFEIEKSETRTAYRN